jgi:hypothetical protein
LVTKRDVAKDAKKVLYLEQRQSHPNEFRDDIAAGVDE